MKKVIAILITSLIMLVSVFGISACRSKDDTSDDNVSASSNAGKFVSNSTGNSSTSVLSEKVFSNDELGVSITMDLSFSKGAGYIGTAWCLTSSTAVFQLIVDKSAGSSASQISETLYLNTMISLAGSTVSSIVTEPTTNENGLSYVTYYSKQNSVDYFFMDTVKKVGNVFYVLEFYCNKDKEEDFSVKFVTWAESFTVSSTSNSTSTSSSTSNFSSTSAI